MEKVLVHELPASTIILSGRSAFFRTMFASRFKEASFKAGIRQVDVCLYREGGYTDGNPPYTRQHAHSHSIANAFKLPCSLAPEYGVLRSQD